MDLKFSVDGTKHEFDSDRITFGEARAIEKVVGYPFGDLGKHMQALEMTTVQAVIWVAMKRADTTLKFSDLDDLSIGDVELHDDEPEEGESPDPPEGEEPTSPS